MEARWPINTDLCPTVQSVAWSHQRELSAPSRPWAVLEAFPSDRSSLCSLQKQHFTMTSLYLKAPVVHLSKTKTLQSGDAVK